MKRLKALFGWIAARGDELSIALITAFLAVVAANTQAGLLYILNAVLGAFLVMGYILPRLALRGLKAARSTEPELYEGGQAHIRLRLRNAGKYRKYLIAVHDRAVFREDQAEESFLVPQLAPGGEEELEYSKVAEKRGKYRFAAFRASTSAPFGLFPASKELAAPGELTVFPVPFPFEGPGGVPRRLQAPQNVRTLPISGQSHDFLGVREYQPGEDIRYIHWTSSARTGTLMLQEFMKPSGALTGVFVDTSKAASVGKGLQNTLEYAVKVATTFLYLSRRSGGLLRFLAVDREELGVFDPSALHDGLDYLASLEATGLLRGDDVMRLLPRRLPPGSTLVIITPQTAFPCDFFEAARDRRLHLVVFLLEAPTIHPGSDFGDYEAAQAALEGAGAAVRRITRIEEAGG